MRFKLLLLSLLILNKVKNNQGIKMEEKIYALLQNLDYAELKKLERDLQSGAYIFKSAVKRKVFALENEHKKVCASCGKKLKLEIDDAYTLLFGEQTIRKKASFCGMDCLDEFTSFLKVQKQNSLMNSNSINVNKEESFNNYKLE